MAYIKKHLREGLKVLDKSYSIKRIDFEDCLYKDLGNGIDFEISHGRTGYTIFVWQYKPYLKILETVPEEKPVKLENLKSTLINVENKYKNFKFESR